jgi:hypothetical protein
LPHVDADPPEPISVTLKVEATSSSEMSLEYYTVLCSNPGDYHVNNACGEGLIINIIRKNNQLDATIGSLLKFQS